MLENSKAVKASEEVPSYSLCMKGHLSKLEGVKGFSVGRGGGKRGKVRTFSSASRRRMLYTVAKCGDALPIFITLTYGKDWPDDPSVLNRHVEAFWKRLQRGHDRGGELCMIWKKEWQKRGAPHFHGLLYLASGETPWVCKDWIATNWAEVTGDVSEAHLRAGTRVEALRSANGGKYYCAKYMGKDQSIPPGIDTGRLWGVLSRKNLPVIFKDVPLSVKQVAAYRMVVSGIQAEQWARRLYSKSDFTVETPIGFDGKQVIWETDEKLLGAWRLLVKEEEENQREYLLRKPRAIQQHHMGEGNLLEKMEALIKISELYPSSQTAELLDRFSKDL